MSAPIKIGAGAPKTYWTREDLGNFMTCCEHDNEKINQLMIHLAIIAQSQLHNSLDGAIGDCLQDPDHPNMYGIIAYKRKDKDRPLMEAVRLGIKRFMAGVDIDWDNVSIVLDWKNLPKEKDMRRVVYILQEILITHAPNANLIITGYKTLDDYEF